MRKKRYTLSLILFSFLLIFCKYKSPTFGEDYHLSSKGSPNKIEFNGVVFETRIGKNKMNNFEIIDKKEVEEAFKEILNATFYSPLKGAHRDTLRLIYSDTTILLYTYGMEISTETNGIYYKLKSQNFINKRVNDLMLNQ